MTNISSISITTARVAGTMCISKGELALVETP